MKNKILSYYDLLNLREILQKCKIIMNKSVIMIVSKYHGVGGVDTVINNLCLGLQKLGYETSIGAFEFFKNPPRNINKVKLSRFKTFSTDIIKKIGVIHIHETKLLYNTIFQNIKQPIIFHYHGANGKIQEYNLKAAMKISKKKISGIIAVSNSGKTDLEKIANAESIQVIHNGVDVNFFRNDIKKEIVKDAPQFLFVGNLYPTKNVGNIIKGMPIILKEFPNAHLKIVGNGKEFNKIKQKIKELNLQKYIEMLGRVSMEKLRTCHSSCDIYISASSFEVYPVPPLEAMSCGKPLLLSDIEPHKEMIEFSKAGLIFSSFNSDIINQIQEILENYVKFGENGRSYVEKNDWIKMSEKVVSIYNKFS